jgi:branched-chain amino acid transport system substrate-binding protein
MDRRRVLKGSVAATASLAFSGLGAARAQAGDIKIGFMAPLTGVAAAAGKEAVEGFELYWKQKNNQAGGRTVTTIIEDDAGNPNTALQKARRLVEQNKVDFLIGNVLANTGLAVAEYVAGNGVPYFAPIIAADDLTQRNRIPNVVRIAGFSASQLPRPLADYAYKKLGKRKIATIAQDYSFGHENCGGFAQTFTEAGGSIPLQLWNPINTADFSPYFAQIQSAGVDAVFATELGADGNRFLKQWSAFGLKGKIALLGAINLTDQGVIRTLTAEEASGVLSSGHVAEGSDSADVQNFVKLYEQAYSKIPSLMGFSFYSGAMWLDLGIQSVGGKVDDHAKFLEAIRKVSLTNSPFGRPVRLDSYGNPIYDVFIREVKARADGKLWNVPIETYPNVSQFWTYDPATYLKQPTYSREFQGIKKS